MKKYPLPHLEDQVKLEVHTYPSDVVLKIKRLPCEGVMYVGGVRGKINGFSRSSALKLNFLIRNFMSGWKTLLTLTYPADFPLDGKICKGHLRAFLEFLRRAKTRYVWVLEFQRRGAPHYHLLLSSDLDWEIIAQRWYAIVGSEDPKHLRAGTRIERLRTPEKAAWYMSNYVTKQEQKDVPPDFQNVGRFWGASRMPRHYVMKFDFTYREAAAYLRTYRRWYKIRCQRDWNYKWRWGGLGFTLRDGARVPHEIIRAPDNL